MRASQIKNLNYTVSTKYRGKKHIEYQGMSCSLGYKIFSFKPRRESRTFVSFKIKNIDFNLNILPLACISGFNKETYTFTFDFPQFIHFSSLQRDFRSVGGNFFCIYIDSVYDGVEISRMKFKNVVNRSIWYFDIDKSILKEVIILKDYKDYKDYNYGRELVNYFEKISINSNQFSLLMNRTVNLRKGILYDYRNDDFVYDIKQWLKFKKNDIKEFFKKRKP